MLAVLLLFAHLAPVVVSQKTNITQTDAVLCRVESSMSGEGLRQRPRCLENNLESFTVDSRHRSLFLNLDVSRLTFRVSNGWQSFLSSEDFCLLLLVFYNEGCSYMDGHNSSSNSSTNSGTSSKGTSSRVSNLRH